MNGEVMTACLTYLRAILRLWYMKIYVLWLKALCAYYRLHNEVIKKLFGYYD